MTPHGLLFEQPFQRMEIQFFLFGLYPLRNPDVCGVLRSQRLFDGQWDLQQGGASQRGLDGAIMARVLDHDRAGLCN